jgi:hypothetical protein
MTKEVQIVVEALKVEADRKELRRLLLKYSHEAPAKQS